ncbi:MAG: hypothetical protein Q4C49_03210 [Bacillota bacterium]|nr:hypothetical protein [Bacillota bacterium]
MKENCITIEVANTKIRCAFHFKKNVYICRNYIVEPIFEGTILQAGVIEKEVYYTCFPGETWDAEAENKAMLCLVSDELLFRNRMIFHSVAFIYEGKAFLLTAPSGTGKRTQYLNLKELYKEKVQIISGDNPILHMQEDGEIWVYPTPWNGKEGYGSYQSAPLGGIVCLAQAKENKIRKMTPQEAIMPVFSGIKTYTKTEEVVRKLLELEEKLITSVPVYHFQNTGTLESSQILLGTLRKEVDHAV